MFSLTTYDPVAQWIERLPAEEKVAGSTPVGIARAELTDKANSALFLPWQRCQCLGRTGCIERYTSSSEWDGGNVLIRNSE